MPCEVPPRTLPLSIGYLVPEFPAQTHAFFWRECQALVAAGARVKWLSTRRPAATACRHHFAIEGARQTHYVFPPSAKGVLALLTAPRRAIAALRYVADLRESGWSSRLRLVAMIASAAELANKAKEEGLAHIHVHSCGDAAHLAALAFRLGGPSYSLSLHGDLPVYGVDHLAKMKDAAFIACVTRPLQEQVIALTGRSEMHCPIIWMGVETEKFRVDRPRQQRVGSLAVLTVARLNPTKGHEFALRAIRGAIDRGVTISYQIVGDGPARDRIIEEVSKLELQAHVQLLGSRSEAEVLELLANNDVLLLTSVGLGEAAPVAAMEAMACGLPVVCSRIGGTPEMIADGVDGYLVPQRDTEMLTERLTELANDVQLRERIGSAARKTAVAKFDARKMAGLLLEQIAAHANTATALACGDRQART